MNRIKLTDRQWELIHNFLQEHPHVYVGNAEKCRHFLEGVLWILRSGSQWRLLPESYGNWNSVYKRFCRWSSASVWYELFQWSQQEPDLQEVSIDSTIVRAHACSAGAKKVVQRKRR